jgi:hypothetical protein
LAKGFPPIVTVCIKQTLYPLSNLPKIPYEEEMFGRVASIEKDFYQVRQLTPDIAIRILQSRQANDDPEFAGEHDVFYDIVEKATNEQFVVLVFYEYFFYSHNSNPGEVTEIW